MTDQFSIHAVWAARRESAQECAKRTAQLLQELASCHPLLSSWYTVVGRRGKVRTQDLTLTWQVLEPFFKPCRPIEGERLEDTGYDFRCWTRQPDYDLETKIRIFCGRADTVGGTFNNIWLSLPWMSPNVETLYQPEVLERIMRAMVNAWEPDSCTLQSAEYDHQYVNPEIQRLQRKQWPIPPRGPEVGWFTYLTESRLSKLSGTPPCDEVITLTGRGSFFIISREHLLSFESAKDRARIRKLKAYLEAHHALEPLPEEKPRRRNVQRKKPAKTEAPAKSAAKPRSRHSRLPREAKMSAK